MNTYDVDDAADGCKDHPVLGPATRFLKSFRDYIDGVSDGWSSADVLTRPTKQLQDFIGKYTQHRRPSPDAREATMAEFLNTLPPIKALVTRQKKKGKKFEFNVNWAVEAATPRPAPPVPVPMGPLMIDFKIWRITVNTNSFGLTQMWATSKGGTTFKICRNQSLEPWKMYQVVKVPLAGQEYLWHTLGVEIPERVMPDAPDQCVKLIWEENVHGEKTAKV